MHNPHPLDGAFERVARAGEHLEDLRGRLDALRRAQENAFLPYFDTTPPHQFGLMVPQVATASRRIPVLVGEICYNLRSSLDYLVFELALANSRVRQNGTQFPIDDTEKRFVKHVKEGWLRGVSTDHVEAIKQLQPYNGCAWTKSLREISNPDKHRELIRMRAAHTGAAYSPVDPEFEGLVLPVRRTRHPVVGSVDIKVDFSATMRWTPIVRQPGPLLKV